MKTAIRRSVVWLCIFVWANAAFAQTKLSPDGPYILYDQEHDSYRFIAVDPGGNLVDTVYSGIPDEIKFAVTSDDLKHRFDVTVSGRPVRIPAEIQTKKKLLVVSDPHGDFDSFYSVLLHNHVIGQNYEWCFGKNTFVIIGDIFDRGKDVNTLLWFVYKLEKEASAAGGRVIFLLGNHEDMNLKGNHRYTDKKYRMLADSLQMELQALYAPQSELGRWLRTRNLVQKINGNLIVHAGLSQEFLDRGLTLDQVNATVEEHIGTTTAKLKEIGGDIEFVYRTDGPLWYRGMVSNEKKHKPLSKTAADEILKKYDVKRIIVGHTIFDDVTTPLDGRVITVNVKNAENKKKGRGRGILIRKNKIYVVYDQKLPVHLAAAIAAGRDQCPQPVLK